MKFLFIALFFTSTLAQAQNLFDYTVFTKGNIYAECSDFLGRTGVGGDAYFRDFLIHASDLKFCPLEVKSNVKMIRGSVQGSQHWSCINAGYASLKDTGVSRIKNYAVNWGSLSQQLDHTSQTLAGLQSCATYKVKTLRAHEIAVGSIIKLESNALQSLVVNVHGKRVIFDQVTIALVGASKASSIIWNFPEATEVVFRHSGVNQPQGGQAVVIGFPGTIVAPHAEVTANNVLITGAVFAGSFVGIADKADCSGKVSGQVNPACFRSTIPGIGCRPLHHGK